MPRPTRAELDAEIVEAAAELFTAQGYLGTSVQEIADRVGYSKTGLLHRFPSKERLLAATLRGPLTEFAALRATWSALPDGPERHRRASADLVDLALRHRSRLALLFNSGLPVLPGALAGVEGMGDLGDHRTETLAAFAYPDDLAGTIRAQLAVTGLVSTVAARQDVPDDLLRAPLLRAFRAACGISAHAVRREGSAC
ncbi:MULTISPECIES: TetR/AcrR family transcriptional regulator [unclassified Streptomyces]|uniref:TetR/AcrR family transcriptional regulator n=1 Tax=Streptomyces sp. NBC_00060 TaxID=2975636 RepID=A0AAU2GSV5_9ACTN